MSLAAREAEVRARLDRVVDPELDEAVTELGFVTDLGIDDAGVVRVGFRLPTYWCAANFAFLMADDMRREVAALPWVTRVEVTLGEHMYAHKINRGMAQGLSFQQAFGAEAAGNLDALRRTFLVKAFQRRQEALLRHLLDARHDAARLVALDRDGLRALPLDSPGDRLRVRYIDRRDVIDAGVLAFVDADGVPLSAAGLPAYLQALARVGINAEFNGAICRGLLAARFNDPCIKDGPRQVA
jgi:metal-sulfur cluster biosynthetic enzyme